MGERLTIGFGDAGGDLLGAVIAGVGTVLCMRGEVRISRTGTLESDADTHLARGEGYDLVLEPLAEPVALGTAATVAAWRAHGAIGDQELEGFGAVVRSSAAPAALERTVLVWLGPALAIALAAQRPPRTAGHGDERIDATILRGDPLTATTIGDPRLSTTYDGEGRPIHCGIELWETDESEFADRAAGEAITHATLAEPDGAQTLVTFLACHSHRRQGPGVYLLTRRG